jgi:hypothetical protein
MVLTTTHDPGRRQSLRAADDDDLDYVIAKVQALGAD